MNRGPRNERSRRDAGVTLLELVYVVALMGVLSTVLLGGIAVSLRNQGDTVSRISESRDSQMLVIFFPQDVQSSPPIDVAAATDPSLPSGCSGADEGVNVLRMTWPGYTPSNTPNVFRVSYRVVTTVEGETVMKRYACQGPDASTLGVPSRITVSKAIQHLPVGWTPGTPPVEVYPEVVGASLIVMVLTEESGREVVIAASRRNTSATLPPASSPWPSASVVVTTTTSTTTTTVAPTTVAPTTTDPTATTDPSATTTTTSTTVAPSTTTTVLPSCGAMVAPNPVGRSGSYLTQPLTVNVVTNANCPGAVKLAYSYGNNANQFTSPQPMTATGMGTWTFTIPANADNWKAGNKNIRLYTNTNNPVVTFFGAFTVS